MDVFELLKSLYVGKYDQQEIDNFIFILKEIKYLNVEFRDAVFSFMLGFLEPKDSIRMIYSSKILPRMEVKDINKLCFKYRN